MYQALYRLVFKRIDAETAHRIGFWLIRAVAALPGGPWLLRRLFAPRDPGLRVPRSG